MDSLALEMTRTFAGVFAGSIGLQDIKLLCSLLLVGRNNFWIPAHKIKAYEDFDLQYYQLMKRYFFLKKYRYEEK